jgi:hypothetical protein
MAFSMDFIMLTLSDIAEKAERKVGMEALVDIPVGVAPNKITPALADQILDHLFERGYRIVRHVP